MQVILLERVEKLGMMGQVVAVKPGYARNYLLPQKKALRATKENLASFEQQRKELEAKNLKAREEAEFVANKIEGMMVNLIRQAGETGQLYGSVSARDIASSLKDKGVIIERTQVNIDTPIKALGIHPIRLQLHPEVKVALMVNVALSEEEAKTKAEAFNKEQQKAQEASNPSA